MPKNSILPPASAIERLIQISKEKPLLPETYIPWADKPKPETIYMPEHLISLYGHPLWDTLSREQQVELGRFEVVQVMYGYSWSETLACLFFTRYLLQLQPHDIVYRFLLRECIEEFRHQDMFADAIRAIGGEPMQPTLFHRWLGKLTAQTLSPPGVFMSVLSVEFIADAYGSEGRKNELVYSVLRKVSELHHIEERRHIHFTRLILDKTLSKAGPFRRTWYSILVMLNVLFMRTLYVRRDFFVKLGVNDPDLYTKAARKNLKKNYANECLTEAVDFVRDEIRGFNWFTKPIWRWILSAKV